LRKSKNRAKRARRANQSAQFAACGSAGQMSCFAAVDYLRRMMQTFSVRFYIVQPLAKRF
jgi:hypothetical protein